MREKEIVQTVTIKHQAVGTEATKAAVNSVTDAVKGLGAAAETTGVKQEQATRRQASAAAAFEQLERRVNPAARALADYERAQRLVGRAVDQNAALQERGNAILQTYRDRVAAAGAAHGDLGKGAGLARHELINLSRQAQDVAVSLGSGQGFGTVLLQQGSQILDVLGTSQGGIRGSLASLGTSFRNLFSVGRVAFAGIATAVGGAAFATSSYLSEQKSLERSLVGNRTSSGAINGIADSRSSMTGLSVSETREAALEFAKTGQIHSRVIGGMIETTKNFALVTGQSSKEAAAALAGAFTNMQGIDNLNKQFNFLDGNARRAVENLLLAGRSSEAAALANEKLAASLKVVEGTQGIVSKGWTAIANAASNAASAVGGGIAKYTGLRNTSKMDRAIELDEQISGLEGQGGGDKYFEATLQKLKSELKEIRSELSADYWGKAFNALSASASQAVAAADPLRGSLDAIVGKLTQLRDLQAQGGNVPGLQMALTYYTQIADQIQRQMQAQDALIAKYPGMTLEFAKQVEALEQQNRLLKARENGNEAAVSAAIAYENAIAAGANQTEAAAIQALTLKNNMLAAAQAASSIKIGSTNEVAAQAGDSAAYSKWLSQDHNSFTGPDQTGPVKGSQGLTSAGYAAWLAINRMATANDIITSSLSGGVGGALSSLKAINFQSQGPRGEPFGIAKDFNTLRPGFGTQGDITSAVSQLYDLKLEQAGDDKAAKQAIYADQLAWLQTQPGTIQNLQQQVAIQRAMKDLTDAVNANTDAQNASLNPLYSEGRSALKIGYYTAATGLEGIVGGSGGVDSTPVHMMLTPGEHIKVTPSGEASNDNSKTIINNVNNYFGESSAPSRRSMRQAAQGFAQMMAANS